MAWLAVSRKAPEQDALADGRHARISMISQKTRRDTSVYTRSVWYPSKLFRPDRLP